MSDPLVVHILPALVPYGAERVALELVARLPSRGFRTKLVSLFGGTALQDELQRRNISVTSLARDRHVPRSEIVHALARLLRQEKERAPAVIHTHLFGPDFWMSLARLTVYGRERPKFVSTAHNVDSDDSSMRRLARRWCTHRMDAIGVISEEVGRYVHEDLGVRESRIRFVPNGVDLAHLGLRGPRPFGKTPELLMVGRLESQKGHAVALRALASVSGSWTLRIVGAGTLERELKELAEQLGIASRVHFLGERSDVPVLLRNADLFLFPSQWEGMGVALVEAAVAGVPVLASDLPALRELIPEDRLIEAADTSAWARAITEALADSSGTLSRAERLAPTIRKRYDVETMVDRYAALYRSLLTS